MHLIDIDCAQRYLERGRSFVHITKLGRPPQYRARRKRFIQERRNVAEMVKYAGELRVGDVCTERTEGGDTGAYRVIAIERGLAPITINVTGSCVTTGQRRMMDFFIVSRVKVHEEPT
jgi:hypothetical protein